MRDLTREFRDVGRSAFVATLGCAVVQGTLAAIGFVIRGRSGARDLERLAGDHVVYSGGRHGARLVSRGRLPDRHGPRRLWGIFEWAWGALIVMAVTDYVVRPRLVGKHGHTHPLLTLISLVGGVLAFGLPGSSWRGRASCLSSRRPSGST